MKKEMTSKSFLIGDKIKWRWMGREVKGVIKKIYLKPVTKTFRGTEFRRNASPEKPAYLVKSDAGSEILKSHTELAAVKTKSSN
jgi:hypothetical protein